MKLSKYLGLFLTATLLFSMVTPLQVVLAQDTTVEVNSGNIIAISPAASQGDIPVDIKNIPDLGPGNGVGAFTLDLSWDGEVITADSLTGATLGGWSILTNINAVDSTARITGFATSSFLIADTTVGNMAITAVGNAGTSTIIVVTIVDLADQDGDPINATPVSAPVQIVGAPAVTTGAATDITINSATLNGDLSDLGTATTVDVYFEWGLDTSYDSPPTTPEAVTGTGIFSAPLTGFLPATTYHFRAVADSGIHGIAYGEDLTFITGTTAPVVTTEPATAVTTNSATLNGDLTSLGTATTVDVYFEWGLDTSYDSPPTTPEAVTGTGIFSAPLTGLLPATTYHFRAVADGGIHGIAYGDDLTFITGTTPPAITTDAASAITTNAATLNGELTDMGTATNVDVYFEWGLDTSYDSPPTTPETVTETGNFSAPLTGFLPGTTYHFRAVADGGIHGIAYGEDMTFITGTTPASVTTEAATAVTTSSATLNGNLTVLGTATTVNVSFEYGLDEDYGDTTTPQPMTEIGTYNNNLTGLLPGTTYHFRAVADGGIHGIAYGEDMTFITGTTPPSVTTSPATNVTTSSATLNGELTDIGTAITVNVSFEYGTTIAYGSTTTVQAKTAIGTFSAGLTGLLPGQEYHFRAVAVGDGTSYGTDMSFTTLDALAVTTNAATAVTTNSATLNGDLTGLGTAITVDVYFEYGLDDSYGDTTPAEPLAAVGTFDAGITGLLAGQEYHFRAVADGGIHGIAYGNDLTLITGTTAPVVTTEPATAVTTNSATLNGNLTSLGTATTVNVSFEYGLDTNYGDTTAPQAMTPTGPFNTGLTGLTPGQTYHFRAVADGGIHGTVYGTDAEFTTGTTPPAVTTSMATAVTTRSATLNGDLTNRGTADTVVVYFEWGLDDSYSSPPTTPVAMTETGIFSVPLTGLLPGTTYHFRAVADGGIHGTVYGTDAEFTTGTTPPAVTTSMATAVTTRSATLNGDLTNRGTADTVVVYFEWGLDDSYSSPPTTPFEMTGTGVFNASLTGLTPNTTYHFRAVADGDTHGIAHGEDLTFTTGNISPAVTTSAATGVTTSSATLNGNLTSLGDATTVNVSFEYGLTTSYGSTTTPRAMTAPGTFNTGITGLTPGTTYHFRAKAVGAVTSYGADMTFTTLATVEVNSGSTIALNPGETQGDIPVAIKNIPNLGDDNGVGAFTFDLFWDGDIVTVDSLTGATLGDEWSILTNINSVENTARITGFTISSGFLTANTIVGTLAVTAVGDIGASTAISLTIVELTDKDANNIAAAPVNAPVRIVEAPTVTTGAATGVTTSSAILNGNLTSLGDAGTVIVSFQYGTTTSYDSTTTPWARTATGAFSESLSGLPPGTLYHFRVKADGGIYGTAYGEDMTFTTGAIPPAVATSAATGITTSSATLNGNLTSLGSATTVNAFFDYGLTTAYGNTTTAQAKTARGTFSAGITSLLPGTLYHFRAMANAGAHGTATGNDVTFVTGMTPPAIITSAATDVTTTSANLNGNLTSLGTATTINVSFEYGLTTSYGSTTAPQAKTATGAFNAGLTSLLPGTTYHFRAKADGGAHGTAYGNDLMLTTLKTPPEVATNAATAITINSATLNGDLTSLGTATTINVSFEYGTSESYGSTTTAQAKTATGTFTANLTGLNPGTVYHFRAKATGAHGTASGLDMTFTTLTAPPLVNTNAATAITTNSATLNGNLTSLGTASPVNVSFEYGTSDSYGSTTTAQAKTATGAFSANLTGLLPDQIYHFRAKAVSAHGTNYGTDATFITGTTPPVVATSAATAITTNSATLNGNLTSRGTAATVNVSFEYGLTTSYGSTTAPQAMEATGTFSAGLTSLLPGTLYHYRAKADGDGSSYGADMIFTTRTALAVTTNAASGVTTISATLNGSLTSLGDATTVNVSFEYGTTIAYGSTTAPQVMTATGTFNAGLTGLTAGQTYHFRAKAVGDVTSYGADMTFTTKTPPSVTTSAAASVTTSSATLNGNLTSLGTATTVNVSFEYGTDTTYGSTTTAQAKTATGAFSASLTGLTPGETYYFRAVADGGIHGIAYGNDAEFTTGTTPPAVTTSAASAVQTESATLNGNLTSLGTSTTVNVSFEYGKTTSYGNPTASQAKTATGTFNAGITGLEPGTLYHFRAKAVGAHGTAYGMDMTFTTGTTPPAVNTDASTAVVTNSATLNGNLTSLGTATTVNVSFEYGLTTSYGSSTLVQAKAATGIFSANIAGLTPGTLYNFRAKVAGAHGTAYGANMTFTTTTAPPTVTTSPIVAPTTNGATLNGELDDLGTASTVSVSFEYGTTTSYGSSTPAQVMTATGTFNTSLSGLLPGQEYHFRAKANGGIHGTATGEPQTFTTNTAPPAVTTNAPTAITANGATLNGNLTSLGTATTVNVSFEYGLDTSYGTSTTPQARTATGTFSANLSGLAAGTTYHFHAKAVGDGTDYGADMTFTTGTEPPTVAIDAASDITIDSATINGNLTGLGTATTVNVSFEYGKTTSYGSTTAGQAMGAEGTFNAGITLLSPATTYHFRAKADGGAHGTSYSADMTFTTAAIPPTVTGSAATTVTPRTATLNGNLTPLGTATTVNVSFQYGTTTSYGKVTTGQAKMAAGAFTANLTGLAPNTTYYFRAKADGGAHGIAYSDELTFTTGKALVSIAVTPPTPSIAAGKTQQFVAVGTYSDSSEEYITTTVSWTSSNTARASINATGLAKGLTQGTSTIKASLNSIEGSTLLTITAKELDLITVTPVDPTIALGTNKQFRAVGTYSDNSQEDITTRATWTSDIESVATIGASTGKAISVGTGPTVISASLNDETGTSILTVNDAELLSIAVAPLAQSIPAGRTQPFTATGTYTDTTRDITTLVDWGSNNTTVARINAVGLATSYVQGSAEITATLGTITSPAATLTVDAPVLDSIVVTPDEPTVTFISGTPTPPTVQFQATSIMSDGSTANVTSLATWDSTDITTATIPLNGLTTSVSDGTTTISADLSGKTDNTTLTVRPDTVAPVVTLTSPTDGIELRDTVMTVSGTADDVWATAIVVVNGAAPLLLTLGPAGGFSQTVALNVGSNAILVRVVDDSGNTGASGTVTVVVNPNKPTIVMTSPPAGLLTKNASITVAGTITYATTGTITVNGVSQPANITGGTFSNIFTLADGQNIIAVTAYTTGHEGDSDFLGGSGIRKVTLDRTPPTVTINTPAATSTVSTPLSTVSGTISDPAITSVQLTLNDGTPQTIPVANGAFSQGVTLVSGENTVSVVATDAADNTSAASPITVTLDTASPTVTITSPQNNFLTNIASLEVTGTVGDPTIENASLFINGSLQPPVAIAPDGTFNQTVTLVSEVTSLEVKASDNADNEGTSGAINVRLDNAAPTITIGLTDPTESITITVDSNEALDDLPGVTIGTTSIDMSASGENQWTGVYGSTTNPIEPGSYDVSVAATDQAGNTATSTATFSKNTISVNGDTATSVTTSTTTLEVETNGPVDDASISVTQHMTNPSGNVGAPDGAPLGASAFVEIVASPELRDALDQIYITVNYDPLELPPGTDQNSLKLYVWDATLGIWSEVDPSGVNIIEHFIWGIVTHLSKFGGFGGTTAPNTVIGGGGGGGGIPNTVKVNGLHSVDTGPLEVDDNGIVVKDCQLKSLDEKVTLNITKGTSLLTYLDKALKSLSAEVISPSLKPAGAAIISAYAFGPDGAKFDPAITLTMSYDPATLPGGVDISKLCIAYFDGLKWVALESTVDILSDTVTAEVSHFTQFAVIGKLPPSPSPVPEVPAAPEPAKFEISSLSVSSGTVGPGEPVTIAVTVSNTGGSSDMYTVVLKVGGVEEARKEVTIDAGASQTVEFNVTRYISQTYQIDVNGLIDSFMVEEKPAPSPAPEAIPEPVPTQVINWWLIAGIIVAVLVVSSGIFLVVRRERHK